MAKSVSVKRSNKAPKRLCAKHKASTATLAGDARLNALIKADYHDDVIRWQSNLQRVLSTTDKKWIYTTAAERQKQKQALTAQFNKK